MIQHHLQSQNSSFQTMIKMKQRACPSVQRSQLSWRHAVHSWVGTELGPAAPSLARGQEHSKKRMGWMVLASSEAGPCAASAEGTCLGGKQLRVCMLKHRQVLHDSRRWRCGQWLAGLVLLQGLWMLGLINQVGCKHMPSSWLKGSLSSCS